MQVECSACIHFYVKTARWSSLSSLDKIALINSQFFESFGVAFLFLPVIAPPHGQAPHSATNEPAVARLFAGFLYPRWHYTSEGLLFHGNTIIPFIDRFPKDTELYRIMTTKLDEQQGSV